MGRGVGSSGGHSSHGGFSSHSHSGGGRSSHSSSGSHSSHSSYSSSSSHSSWSGGSSSHGHYRSRPDLDIFGGYSSDIGYYGAASGRSYSKISSIFAYKGSKDENHTVVERGLLYQLYRIFMLCFGCVGVKSMFTGLSSGQFVKAEDVLAYSGFVIFFIWLTLRQFLKLYQQYKCREKVIDDRDSSAKVLRFINKIGGWCSAALIIGALVAIVLGGEEWAPSSTVERTKIDASLCTPLREALWEDDWGTWLNRDIPELKTSMDEFYEKTGVQPYLWITGEDVGASVQTSEALEAIAKTRYDELFTDRGHLLVVFREYPDGSGNYISSCYAGADAELVMDEEAREILLDAIDHYYEDEELSDTQVFSRSFEYTAKTIMKLSMSSRMVTIVSSIVVAIILAAGILSTLRTRRKKYEKEEQTQRTAQVKTELEQQKMQKEMEEATISVVCPGCGATVMIRRGTSATCEFCRRGITVDEAGNIVE